ncbi:histidine--tRNA ligase [Synechococcus sp. Cruz-9H2]|uniref:histidine--tRNA ligase n=1 Tax=unclassified Synechococcus TaxID=2626047 RepID=UPI0020CF9BC9|nr:MULTISPECIES: histidine--tRNA ligase [unclassified Synechococcus]MCP9819895.1 histidine--tRNA ligase [Synechococcus sp. Cruz-9H2]MCP9844201.1 histidine--tRNA ligase [Synechococcus sp. Edmonson 11F2]MCP9856325.1 histidine--tRNA ligase [Synechococcus sp. Cruz-9C9]MCP9863610.1 histidine--tRNA ligase [Synechococcus sp. Cruz-7E5]MCP9870806.1 histidine--tRNA ligase [Synechococcus sp. Cruz-7B9]
MEKLQSLRGMVDLLPEQMPLWQLIEATFRSQFERAALREIRTPLLEVTELFARGIGEATDVVGKEMYTFQDRGERSCTLRPEGTASVVRAALQHGLLSQGPQRLWYTGPMFRYERPQAGRQRQFHQVGIELLGFADPRSDAEAIAIAWDLLSELGVGGLALELNSLGDPADRAAYRTTLVGWLEEHQEQLDADSRERITTNPLRILDSKNPDTQAVLAKAPLLIDSLSEASRGRFEAVRGCLDALEIPYRLNPRLVRGLDYYTHTAFEITSSQLGAQATVCGGGRYDGLIEQLGGSPTAAIGWAIGLERLVLLLAQAQAADIAALTSPTPDVYLVSRGEQAERQALLLSRQLRQAGRSVELDLSGAAFGKQLKRADRCGAPWAVLIGEGEAEQGVVLLKDLRGDGEEQRLSSEQLKRALSSF